MQGGTQDSTPGGQQGPGIQADVSLDDLEDLGIIGSGSSGIAKKVRHRSRGTQLVLKIIQFDFSSDTLRKQVRAVVVRTR